LVGLWLQVSWMHRLMALRVHERLPYPKDETE
jgi:hypothetical protein